MAGPITRRDALAGAIAALGIAAHPGTIWAAVAAAAVETDPRLDRVVDVVIPATDTPGAASVGVGAFVLLALRHADGVGAHGDEWKRFGATLQAAGFDHADLLRQHAILTSFDQATFATRESTSPWRVLKPLIITGYYTSEVGGAHELRYDLVPGRFDPDIPVGPDFRALSNDWVAVNFR